MSICICSNHTTYNDKTYIYIFVHVYLVHFWHVSFHLPPLWGRLWRLVDRSSGISWAFTVGFLLLPTPYAVAGASPRRYHQGVLLSRGSFFSTLGQFELSYFMLLRCFLFSFNLCHIRYLVPGTWHQVLGTKYLVPSTWYQVIGTKYLVAIT